MYNTPDAPTRPRTCTRAPLYAFGLEAEAGLKWTCIFTFRFPTGTETSFSFLSFNTKQQSPGRAVGE